MKNSIIYSLNQELKAKKVSPSELVEETVKRTSTHKNLNCILSVSPDKAKTQAASLDNDFTQLLAGIPVLYKANFNSTGDITNCASKMLENYRSPYNATVVEHMESAGALTIGKANMDEFAMGSTNENSAFGAVLNPFNLAHCAGGSSGGSAAAVAADLVNVAFGSDTGGSVRQPAAFCGVTGLKPTYGRISRYGVVAFASSFDQPGIFARSASDVAITLAQVAHYDGKDSTSVEKANEDYSKALDHSLQGVKLGVVKNLFAKVSDSAMQKSYQEALATYQKLGVQLVDVELPSPELAVAAYYVLSSSECSSNLSRFDGVRYGYRSENTENLEALYVNSRSEGFGAEVKRRILLGTFALSTGYYDAYYLKAQKMRRAILNHLNETFTQVDAIVLPTSLITAPKLGEEFDYNDDMCTITANLAGLPALSHPLALANGLPVGLQLVGKHFAEGQILNLAHQFQLQTDFHTVKPNLA